jgi:hypothetical protein
MQTNHELLRKMEDKFLSEIPDEFLCPISLEIMDDPIICDDGYTYECKSIIALKHLISPFTRKPIDPSKIYPNRAIKESIVKFKKNDDKELKNPLVISKPTHLYGRYAFEIKQNEKETSIKIQNVCTFSIFEGILTEKDIYIKPFSKFNIMINKALENENNYSIEFNEIHDENDNKNNVLDIQILYSNDFLDISQPFTLKEVFIGEKEKQKFKIMSLENKIKNLKSNVIKLKESNETIFLMSKVISVLDEVTGKNENVVIEYKFPKNLEFFDYCEFMKDADIKQITEDGNNTFSIILNSGLLLYHNELSVFTNLKKLKIPKITMIYPVKKGKCNIYSNLFLDLEELIVDVVGDNCCYYFSFNCPNLKKIVIEKIFNFNSICNYGQNPHKCEIEAILAIPNAILENGYRVCEFHKTNLTTATCSICNQIKTVLAKLKEYCDRASIQY